MKRSAEAAWERAMKVQEVILRAIAKQITWWQAAEIIGISDRQLRRWQRRYEEHGYTGLIEHRDHIDIIAPRFFVDLRPG